MVMNGFNTNFDAEGNQLYAVNSIAFHHVNEPVQVRRNELVRIYVVNILEYDPINSLHIHGNFFDYFPTGTRLEPVDFTDTIVLGQGQRGILRAALPQHRAVHVPRPQERVRRSRLDGLLRGLLMAAEEHGERAGATDAPRLRAPTWALAVVPLALIAVAIALFAAFGGATLGDRLGPPLEELAVERTMLRPGAIELTRSQRRPRPGADRSGRGQRRVRRVRHRHRHHRPPGQRPR